MNDKKQKNKSPDEQPEKRDRADTAGAPGSGNASRDEAGAPPRPEAGEPRGDDRKPGGWGDGEMEELRTQNAELKDKLLRTVAEMENVRRRTERDKQDTAKYAISNFARDVLSVADNIQRAIAHVPAEAAEQDAALKSFLEGMQVTERELLNIMERHGITRLDPKGERFDPNMHQAMFEVPNPQVPEGTVIEVVQPGYVIADRVLRPAMVGVAKGGAKPSRDPAPEPPKAANDDAPQDGPGKTPPEGPPGPQGPGGRIDRSA